MMRYAFSLLNILLFAIICFFDKQILSDYGFSVVWILMFSFIGVIFFSYKNCIKVKCIKAVCILGIFCFFTLFLLRKNLLLIKKKYKQNNLLMIPFKFNLCLKNSSTLGNGRYFSFWEEGKYTTRRSSSSILPNWLSHCILDFKIWNFSSSIYFAGNLGFQLAWFCNFPIISEGVRSITANIILIIKILFFS